MQGRASMGSDRGWQLNYVATFIAIFGMYVGIRYATVVIHETLGHGATARMLGGSFFAFYASPLGGFASLHLPGMSASMLALVLLSGIIVTGLTGMLALAASRRAKGGWRIVLLLYAEGAIMSSTLYLACGGLIADGDPYVAMGYLGWERDSLAPVGIIATLLASVLLSREFVKVDPYGIGKPFMRSLGLWLPGIVMGAVALAAYLMNPENTYSGMYGGIYIFAALGSSYVVSLSPDRGPLPARVGAPRQLAAVLVCLMLAGYCWVGVFGESSEEAKGLMLEEPPIEVESSYLDGYVGNARVVLHPNGSAMVEVILKPLKSEGSPLDMQIHSTFEERPYLPFWASQMRDFASGMLNLSVNQSAALNITAELGGEAEALNQTYANARTCRAWVTLNTTENYSVSLADPWLAEGGFVDKLTVEWVPPMTLASYVQAAGSPPVTSENSLTWKSTSRGDSPVLVLVNLTP